MLSMRDTLMLRLRESEDETNVLRDVVAAARHQNPSAEIQCLTEVARDSGLMADLTRGSTVAK